MRLVVQRNNIFTHFPQSSSGEIETIGVSKVEIVRLWVIWVSCCDLFRNKTPTPIQCPSEWSGERCPLHPDVVGLHADQSISDCGHKPVSSSFRLPPLAHFRLRSGANSSASPNDWICHSMPDYDLHVGAKCIVLLQLSRIVANTFRKAN